MSQIFQSLSVIHQQSDGLAKEQLYIKEINDLVLINQRLEQQLIEQADSSEMRTKYQQAIKEQVSMTSALQAAQQHSQKLEMTVQQLTERLGQQNLLYLATDQQSAQKQITNIVATRQRCDQLTEQLKQIQLELMIERQTTQTAEAQLHAAQIRLEEAEQLLVKQNIALKQLQQSDEDESEVKIEKQKVLDEVKELIAKTNTKDSEIEELKLENSVWSAELAECVEQRQKMNSVVQELKMVADEREKQTELVKTKLELAEKQLQSANAKLSDKTDEVERLQTKSDQLTVSSEKMNFIIKKLLTVNETKENEIQIRQEQNSQFKLSLQKAEQSIQKSIERIKQQDAEISSYKLQLQQKLIDNKNSRENEQMTNKSQKALNSMRDSAQYVKLLQNGVRGGIEELKRFGESK